MIIVRFKNDIVSVVIDNLGLELVGLFYNFLDFFYENIAKLFAKTFKLIAKSIFVIIISLVRRKINYGNYIFCSVFKNINIAKYISIFFDFQSLNLYVIFSIFDFIRSYKSSAIL